MKKKTSSIDQPKRNTFEVNSTSGFDSDHFEDISSSEKAAAAESKAHLTSGYESQGVDGLLSQIPSSLCQPKTDEYESTNTSEGDSLDSLEDYQSTLDFQYGEPESSSTAAANISASSVDSQLSELATITTQLITGAGNGEHQHLETIPGYLQPQQLAPIHPPLPLTFYLFIILLMTSSEADEEESNDEEPRMDLTSTVRPFIRPYPQSSDEESC